MRYPAISLLIISFVAAVIGAFTFYQSLSYDLAVGANIAFFLTPIPFLLPAWLIAKAAKSEAQKAKVAYARVRNMVWGLPIAVAGALACFSAYFATSIDPAVPNSAGEDEAGIAIFVIYFYAMIGVPIINGFLVRRKIRALRA